MISIGIESTAHTFGVGVITDGGKILANEKSIYKPPLGSGIHPRKAFEHHSENAFITIQNAFKKTKITFDDVDIISFSQGPGLPNCLVSGASIARFLSLKYKKPLIGVNHCIAHIEIAKLTSGSRDPIALFCSGGNTQIIAFTEGKYRIFGETEDIPIGNAFDVLARHLGLEMPGGPKIEELAKKGKWVDLPYVVKGMDFSFSGVVTECRKLLKNRGKEDICYSFQETCFAMLTEATERALAHTDKKVVLLTGGVAANKKLQEMLNTMCGERGARFYTVPFEYSGDNGLMIAWAGVLAYKSGQRTRIQDSWIKPDWRTDEVNITWL